MSVGGLMPSHKWFVPSLLLTLVAVFFILSSLPFSVSSLFLPPSPQQPSRTPDARDAATPVAALRTSWSLNVSDVYQMSDADVRRELHALYNLQSDADGAERGCVQETLARVRQTMPITHGLVYGPLWAAGNHITPTALVVWSHGLGGNSAGWGSFITAYATRMPHAYFLVTSAPVRSIALLAGRRYRAWFGMHRFPTANLSLPPTAAEETQLWQSVDYIRSLAYTTAQRLKIPPQRIVYAGFSQGAAISLATGLTAAPYAPAGVICMSGYLAAAPTVVPKVVNRAVPIAMFHGHRDSVIPFSVAEATHRLLVNEVNVTASVKLRAYNRLAHAILQSELSEVYDALLRMLPETL